MPELLASVHDVAPFHLERLRRAEDELAALGVTRVAYLLVPDFHGRGRADRDDAFVAWCRAPRPFRVDWVLHGYTHRDDTPASTAGRGWTERWKGKHMTGGEGEFLTADAAVLEDRLRRGRDVFRAVLGPEPEGFVAPAWLYTAVLPPLLARLGFRWTEDHGAVHDLRRGTSLRAPVITWATRTPIRRRTSVLGTPLLWGLWKRRARLRLAVHPFDFDHADTAASIRRVWRRALASGPQRGYEEVLFRVAQ
jgi:predicted deacetylase